MSNLCQYSDANNITIPVQYKLGLPSLMALPPETISDFSLVQRYLKSPTGSEMGKSTAFRICVIKIHQTDDIKGKLNAPPWPKETINAH